MKSKEQLIEIWEDTQNCIEVGGYENSMGEWIDLPKPKEWSKFYNRLPKIKEDLPQYEKTKIYVKNSDTLQAASPGDLVLNMASFVRPGGGVDNGSRAQEEELFRRTTLGQHLFPFADGRFGQKAPKDYKYPIPMFGGIYSPDVKVFKRATSYSYLDEPFEVSVVSVAALRKPSLVKGLLQEDDIVTTKGKIRTMLRIGIVHKHPKLILGAFGCGAYGNPPKQVAELFKEVLAEEEFAHSFEEICFAIIDDRNSNGNLRHFSEVFQ